jgi:hypothetical protein
LCGDGRDVENYLESAVGTYTDQGELRYVARTPLLFYEAFKQRSQYKDAAKTLMRYINDVGIQSEIASMFVDGPSTSSHVLRTGCVLFQQAWVAHGPQICIFVDPGCIAIPASRGGKYDLDLQESQQ